MTHEKFKYLKSINTDNLESNLFETLAASSVRPTDFYFRSVDLAYLLYLIEEHNINDFSEINTVLDLIQNDEDLKASYIIKIKPIWKKFISTFRFKFTTDEYLSYVLFSKNKSSRYEAESSTPTSIIKLANKLLDIKDGMSVSDICSGNGEYLLETNSEAENLTLSGIEILESAVGVSRERLNAIEAEYIIENADVFDTTLDEVKYDRIFSNYPFAMRTLNQESKAEELLDLLNMKHDKVKIKTTDWLFTLLTVSKLKETGKAVVIMPNGTAFNTIERGIRKSFVDKGLVETVIQLPVRLFNNTAISVTLMVLSFDNEKINFIDASNIFTPERKCNTLSNENIDAILSMVGTESDISTVKTLKEIANNGYSLVANQYFETIRIENGVEFKSLIKKITRGAQLKSNELDELHSEVKTPYQYLTIANVTDGAIDFDNDSQYITSIADNQKKYCINKRSLVVSKIASPELKAAVVEVDENTTILANGNLYVIELDETKVNPYYVQAFFDSDFGKAIISPKLNGIAFKMITVSGLNELQIPLPDMETQNKIAKKHRETINKIKELKKELNSAKTMLSKNYQE